MKRIRLHKNDNVEIVLEPENNISVGHKIAASHIKKDSNVIKLGHAIGVATQDIAAGEHVHVHNIRMPNVSDYNHAADSIVSIQKKKYEFDSLPNTFMGYQRKNKSVGTRNYIAVVSTVNCSAAVVKAIVRHYENTDLNSSRNIDGVIAVTHTQGCAQEIGGRGYEVLNQTLSGWIQNPNVVATLVVGLGCEGTTLKSILAHSNENEIEYRYLGIQENNGTLHSIEKGIKLVQELIDTVPKFERTKCEVQNITLGLNCGGSDSFSSITANPVLGMVSDIIVSKGGSVILGEIPECHGAESNLESRCVSADVKNKLKRTFVWWDQYLKHHHSNFNNNLSPGNISGGISTILEKTLGAVAKAGSSTLVDVVDYSEKSKNKGFILMNTPGFDPVSVTGIVAGGANIVAFTTGRGSVYGCSISPTIKISTTTGLYQKMISDIDFNAGEILEKNNISEVSINLYKDILSVASGLKTKSEKLKIGQEEFIPWAIGETL